MSGTISGSLLSQQEIVGGDPLAVAMQRINKPQGADHLHGLACRAYVAGRRRALGA